MLTIDSGFANPWAYPGRQTPTPLIIGSSQMALEGLSLRLGRRDWVAWSRTPASRRFQPARMSAQAKASGSHSAVLGGRRSEGRRFEGRRFEGRRSEGRRFEGRRFEGSLGCPILRRRRRVGEGQQSRTVTGSIRPPPLLRKDGAPARVVGNGVRTGVSGAAVQKCDD